MTTRPVAVRVSQATRLKGSSVKQASRMASEIWAAILSGWPSVTDSEVNIIRFFVVAAKWFLLKKGFGFNLWRETRAGRAFATWTIRKDDQERSPLKGYQTVCLGAMRFALVACGSIE